MKTDIWVALLTIVIALLSFSSVAAEPVPVLAIDARGSLPVDGSQCITVGADGIAKVYFELPAAETFCEQEISPEKYRNRTSPVSEGMGVCTAMDQCLDHSGALTEGYDYGRHPLYVMTRSIKDGEFAQHSSYHEQQDRILHTIETDKQPGDVICLKAGSLKRVPSGFEVYLNYLVKLIALKGIDVATGGSLRNFAGGSFLESLPANGMLAAQVEFNALLKNELEVKYNYAPGKSSCSLAAVYGLLSLPLSRIGDAPDMSSLTPEGGFKSFWVSALAGNILDCVDLKGVMPYVSEKFSPSTGSQRSKGSQMVGNLFKGPGWLALLYTNQMITDPWPALRVKLTIKSAINSRNFKGYVNESLASEHPELVQMAQDGLFMISLHPLDEPSQVMTVFVDEYINQMGADAIRYLPYADASLENDQAAEYIIYFFETLLYGTVGSMALGHVLPGVGGVVGEVASWPMISTPINAAKGIVQPVVTPLAKGVGTTIQWTNGMWQGAMTTVSKTPGLGLAWSYVPSLPAKGAGRLATNALEQGGRSFLKGAGMGLILKSVSPRLIGPMVGTMTDSLAELIGSRALQSGNVVEIDY